MHLIIKNHACYNIMSVIASLIATYKRYALVISIGACTHVSSCKYWSFVENTGSTLCYLYTKCKLKDSSKSITGPRGCPSEETNANTTTTTAPAPMCSNPEVI